MSRPTRVIAGLFVTMAVTVGSACGASTPAAVKKGATTVPEKSATTKRTPATTLADEKPKTTARPTTKPSTKPAARGSFCDMAAGYNEALSESLFDFDDPENMPDPDQIMAEMIKGMDEIFDYLKDMAKVAPSGVRADLELLLDVSDDYMAVLRDAKSLDDPALEKAGELMETPKIKAASDRFEAYVKDDCGVDFDDAFIAGSS